MKDRIVKFLGYEKISPAEFADKIGVQRSSMSHILNGRNYPSASFLQKMLQVYPLLNPRWLMIGEGEMNSSQLKEAAQTSTIGVESLEYPQSNETKNHTIQFNLAVNSEPGKEAKSMDAACDQVTIDDDRPSSPLRSEIIPEKEIQVMPESIKANPRQMDSLSNASEDKRELEQILFFYKDKTFTVYKPS